MRRTLGFLLVLAAAGVAFAAAPRSPLASGESEASETLLDERAIAFCEDAEAARAVGEVRARLVRDAAGVRLHVVAAAVGPRVDAAPGPEGVRGGNRISAEELDALLARKALALRVRGPGDGPPAAGRVRGSRRGPLILRALSPDGRVTHVAAGGADLALEATLETPPLPDGISRVEVTVDGDVRVRAVVRVGPRGGRVLSLDQVPHSQPEARP
jgi:hypothetical protein